LDFGRSNWYPEVCGWVLSARPYENEDRAVWPHGTEMFVLRMEHNIMRADVNTEWKDRLDPSLFNDTSSDWILVCLMTLPQLYNYVGYSE
jgi:hypothetical protein